MQSSSHLPTYYSNAILLGKHRFLLLLTVILKSNIFPNWLADRMIIAGVLKHLYCSLPPTFILKCQSNDQEIRLLKSTIVSRLFPHLLVPIEIYLSVFIGSWQIVTKIFAWIPLKGVSPNEGIDSRKLCEDVIFFSFVLTCNTPLALPFVFFSWTWYTCRDYVLQVI